MSIGAGAEEVDLGKANRSVHNTMVSRRNHTYAGTIFHMNQKLEFLQMNVRFFNASFVMKSK
jgi:hypothetical protein